MHASLALSACLLVSPLLVAPPPGIDWAKRLAATKVPLAEAVDRALKAAGGGVAVRADLAEDAGLVFWSVRIAEGAKTRTVFLDAGDGHALRADATDKDRSDVAKACTLGLRGAVERALAAAPGSAVEVKLDVKKGKPLATVEVWGAGKLTVVKLDGATGAVLSAAPAKPPAPPKAPGAGKAPAPPAPAPTPAPEAPFTEVFAVDAAEWTATGANRFFSLEPGFRLVLEGGGTRLTVTVLDETKVVDGVETRVVEEREEEDGRLIEISRNYFAMSKLTSAVYYFGEDVDMYKDGKVVAHTGAWLSGVNGARWGLMMPGTPLLGARYAQEIAPGVAMDRAVIAAVADTIETPGGKFTGCCLRTDETTPLEPGARETKAYAPGVGLIRDADLLLTSVTRPKR